MQNEKINLSGYALTRQVFYNSTNLEQHNRLAISPSPFDWGYDCDKSKFLTSELIRKALDIPFDETVDEDLIYTVHHTVTCLLPKGNFNARINLKPLLDIGLKKRVVQGTVHAYQAMELKYGAMYVPMCVAFLDLPYKTFILRPETEEFKYLSNLSFKELSVFKSYLRNQSKRKSLKSTQDEAENANGEVFITVEKVSDTLGECFLVKNGYGSETYHGTIVTEQL